MMIPAEHVLAQVPVWSSVEARAYADSVWPTDEILRAEPGTEPVPECATNRETAMDRTCVEAMLRSELVSSELAWERALDVVIEIEDDALTWDVFRRYRPLAGCSRDSRPAVVAQQMAEFCVSTGRVGCAVQMLTRTLTHSHARASDMIQRGRPVSYVSPLPELAAVVDVPRFVTGMLVPSTDESVPQISPYYVGLSAAMTDFAPEVRQILEAWVSDSTATDEVRVLALQTWAWLTFFEGAEREIATEMAADLPGAAEFAAGAFSE
jgi:hypothetical protein